MKRLPERPLVSVEAGLNEANHPVHEFEEFGGAWRSRKVLGFIAALDPLSYGIDGMRSVLLSGLYFHPAFGPRIDLAVLVGVGSILLVIGAWRFSKIEI